MEIKATIKSSLLTEDETINIKGGINSQSVEIASSCTDCNCWFGNENKREKAKSVEQSTQIIEMID